MSTKPIAAAFATLLILTPLVFTAFFLAPQKASAAGISGAVSCLLGAGTGAIGGTVSSFTGVPVAGAALGQIVGHTSTAAGATTGDCIWNTIVMPLARLLARMMLQQITASVVDWINGTPGKHGMTMSSFVQNIGKNLQSAADIAAMTFITQTGTALYSAFGSAVSTSLKGMYLQKTSLAGFYSTNRSTLSQFSPNVGAYLAGRFSQGGISAWFALTTQVQNNPYLLFQQSANQLGRLVGAGVGGATGAVLADLGFGKGFGSWCGTGDSDSIYNACVADCVDNEGGGPCVSACNKLHNRTTTGSQGTNPGASCVNSDGTAGTVKTPGSVIHEYTSKAVVGAGIDQLISANDLDSALTTIVDALVRQVLSGFGGSGLSGASSGGSQSMSSQLRGYSGDGTTGTPAAISTAQLKLTQLSSFTTAWNSIKSSANTASTALQGLASFCTTAAAASADSVFKDAATAQAAAASTALSTIVTPVFAQFTAAINSASTTEALALRVQSEAVGGTSASSAAALAADMQRLALAAPSASDVSNAQANASMTGQATSAPANPPFTPANPLLVMGGSIADQMALLTTNATELKASVCTPVSAGGGGGGGGGDGGSD